MTNLYFFTIMTHQNQKEVFSSFLSTEFTVTALGYTYRKNTYCGCCGKESQQLISFDKCDLKTKARKFESFLYCFNCASELLMFLPKTVNYLDRHTNESTPIFKIKTKILYWDYNMLTFEAIIYEDVIIEISELTHGTQIELEHYQYWLNPAYHPLAEKIPATVKIALRKQLIRHSLA